METLIGSIREVGRELKVSELQTHTVVVLQKHPPPCPLTTVWVMGVHDSFVHFAMGRVGPNNTQVNFIARRTGENNDYIRDDEMPMKIYEYLGEI